MLKISYRTVSGFALALTLNPILFVYADTVSIPPQSTSIQTLNAIQLAIDTAAPEGRVILLEPGLYDFSAVMILNPPDPSNPPAGYSVALGGAVHFYDPHKLPPVRGYGVVIRGDKTITLRGAPIGTDGMPTTIILGNVDPRALNPILNPAGLFNVGVTVGGDSGEPSRGVTVERINFQSFTLHVRAVSATENIVFQGGTEDLLIRDNIFDDVFQGIAISGRVDMSGPRCSATHL